VKAYRFKIGGSLTARWIRVAALAFLLAISAAQATTQAKEPAKPGPIRITADQLTADNKEQTAEFSGNVTAVQGDTKITAERLKLFYGKQDGSQDAPNQTNIDKIEAYGDVRILFDNRLAEAEQAVYTTLDRKLVLTGRQAKVTSGQDVIMGSEIIFNRGSGQVVINRDDDSQVRAIIHSDHRGLN
jgi:lipopolysaccharide export system protein LptA